LPFISSGFNLTAGFGVPSGAVFVVVADELIELQASAAPIKITEIPNIKYFNINDSLFINIIDP
jgi:hypothetical protein